MRHAFWHALIAATCSFPGVTAIGWAGQAERRTSNPQAVCGTWVLQAIQPAAFDWQAMYRLLHANRATYCEVYAPSFTKRDRAALAVEIRKFAQRGPGER